MKKVLAIALIGFIGFGACSKDDNDNNPADNFETLKTKALLDFTNIVAVSNYADLDVAATTLNNRIQDLSTSATETNLAAVKDAWRDMRSIWEQAEGFLFGPVEDNDYDPNMDTWPTDYVQMDSLLASSNALTENDIEGLTLSLRGYHPIEYIIFGDHGSRIAASLTDRQKVYMVSLAADLKATCHALYLSWTEAPINFSAAVVNAGSGSTVYAKKQDAYLAIVEGLIAICEEVGEGKMLEPFNAMDPALVESPYSGNSTIDFKNNITGLQNVYLSRYGTADGKGLADLVAAKNISLDNTLQSQITAAINSFNNITVPYEEAIISQRTQVQQTMDALATLKETLDTQLKPFILQNILD